MKIWDGRQSQLFLYTPRGSTIPEPLLYSTDLLISNCMQPFLAC